jgi:hypothetical protein
MVLSYEYYVIFLFTISLYILLENLKYLISYWYNPDQRLELCRFNAQSSFAFASDDLIYKYRWLI